MYITGRALMGRFGITGTLALTVCSAAGKAAGDTPKKPNVVLIVADDLGYGDLGCYGAKLIKTPRIDTLASEGIRFLEAHSTASVCGPSRYAILSGRYDWRRGKSWGDGMLVVTNGEVTLPEVLKNQGYHTAGFGKWHLGFGRNRPDYNKELKPGPLEVGFDYYFGTPNTHNEPPFVFVENHYVVGLDPNDPIRIIPSKEAQEQGLPDWGWGSSVGAKAAHAARPLDQIDTILKEKAVAYISQQSPDTPFFMYIPFLAPHVPNAPSARFLGSSKAGKYGDVIQELDWCVGEVLDCLQKQGLAENTLVIFTSDNGGVYLADALDAGHHCDGLLLGQKTDAWNGGHQVPFIVRWPGKVPTGKTTDKLFSLSDIMATIAAATGAELPAGAAPDSLNQLSVFLNPDTEKPVRTKMIYSGIFGQGLRSGDWVYYPLQGSGGMTANPTQRWGVFYQDMGVTNSDLDKTGQLKKNVPLAQLYNVVADIGQTKNVYSEYPERVAMMQKEWQAMVGPIHLSPTVPIKTKVGWNDALWGASSEAPDAGKHYIVDNNEVWLHGLGKYGAFKGASLTLKDNATLWISGTGPLGEGILVLDGGQLQNRFNGQAILLGRIQVDAPSTILNITGDLDIRTGLSGKGDLRIGELNVSGKTVAVNCLNQGYSGTFILANTGQDNVHLAVEFKNSFPKAGLTFQDASLSRMPVYQLKNDIEFRTVNMPSADDVEKLIMLAPGTYNAAALRTAGVHKDCFKDQGGTLIVDR